MTELERLEEEFKEINEVISKLDKMKAEVIKIRDTVFGKLNRARRLEREELQNAKY